VASPLSVALGPVRAVRQPGGSVPCAHMPRAPRITSADLLRALHRAGWTTSRQSGSHVILVHPERAGARVVVPVHAGRILKPKTLAAILKSAEIAGDELPGLL
jgi:predicted RNA binding protein YcfA (HicA-like mRNA interferase family)